MCINEAVFYIIVKLLPAQFVKVTSFTLRERKMSGRIEMSVAKQYLVHRVEVAFNFANLRSIKVHFLNSLGDLHLFQKLLS